MSETGAGEITNRDMDFKSRQGLQIGAEQKCITAGCSNNSCSNMVELFKNMFRDSDIAKTFQLGPNKVKYLANFDRKSYLKDLLAESIKKFDCYIVSFDESLNKLTQNCEMDLLLRYFDSSDDRVKVRFYHSCFLGHATHSDFVQQLNDATKDLNLTTCTKFQ